MNISVIGTGYVGLITGTCLAEFGMDVICMDTDEEKINNLKKGNISIYEPGLKDIFDKNTSSNRLKFTTNIKEAMEKSQVIFIAVGTPQNEDDSADLKYVFKVVEDIAFNMNEYKVIVNKSTVPVGTGEKIKTIINNILSERGKNFDFDIVSNPEFLREGTAVKDFIKADRIVIGVDSDKAENLMKKIYGVQTLLDIPLIITNIQTSELIKYASNAFLATKISFINEIANLCESCDADITIVSKAMGLDKRIGPKFLNAGAGYGGSCFPKDTKALISIGENHGLKLKIVKSVVLVNEAQRSYMVKKIKNHLKKFRNKTVSILGLAFKPETDDIRESPSISIIEELLKCGIKVKAYDPVAMSNTKMVFPHLNIEYFSDLYSACKDSDCVVLITEWNEFLNIDFTRLKSMVHTPIFIDLRNVYESSYVKSYGFIYEGVGKKWILF